MFALSKYELSLLVVGCWSDAQDPKLQIKTDCFTWRCLCKVQQISRNQLLYAAFQFAKINV